MNFSSSSVFAAGIAKYIIVITYYFETTLYKCFFLASYGQAFDKAHSILLLQNSFLKA
jgi:hypothetical protein